MALMVRPDLRVVEFRGNVQTRLRKLAEGVADATMLALAGLNRLGLSDNAASVMDVGDFLPAVGQGAIGIETRLDDTRTRELLAPINDPATEIALRAERAFLATLDGSCRTPIGGLAIVHGDHLHFSGIIVSPDGTRHHRIDTAAGLLDAERMGQAAGADLKQRGGPDFFAGG
jgi:hydroxymethylbilane synthase